jgi:serine/threonine-protein kinase
MGGSRRFAARVVVLALSLSACGGETPGAPGSSGGGGEGAASAGPTSSATTGAATTGAAGGASGAGLFEAPHAWNKDVSGLPKSPASDAIIGWLDHAGGWGNDGVLQIDFSIEVMDHDGSAPRAFEPTDEFYSPDCDQVPFPLPAGGALEGESGYACESDGDCHLIVVDRASQTLYEMWRANVDGGGFYGGCAAVWDLAKVYPDDLRGEGCTSADAGGFPIAAMLFSADEVVAGSIDHAIRFILPNERIRENVYVHPGTHSTFPTSGGPDAPPYGVRFRLRADYPIETLPTAGARVVARALQTYGMFLADGGQIALTAQSDRFTTHSWAEAGVDPHALAALQVTDMEVVDMGEPIEWSGDCERNP